MMTPSRLLCSLTMALGLAAPAQAQFDLLRLIPGTAPMDGSVRFRQHADAIKTIWERNAAGDLKGALRLADALVVEDRKVSSGAARSPDTAMLRQSIAIAADLHQRDGNHARAIELWEMFAGLPPGPAERGMPSDFMARSRIGELQLQAGDAGAAKRIYQDLLARPEAGSPLAMLMLPKLHAGLGKAALQTGDDALAETHLLLAIRLDPAIAAQPMGKAPGRESGFFDAMTMMNAASGRIQDALRSIAPDHAVLDDNGEILSSFTGNRVPVQDSLEVQGPLTDLASLYFRRRDSAAIQTLYLGTFADYAARSARAQTGGLGPPGQLEQQYARFGSYLAGLQEYLLAEQAFDNALRLNAQRLSVAAVQVVPEQLAAFFSARRRILDLAISLRLARSADAAGWRATIGDVLQSKGLQNEFLARRARLIGRSTDPEVRRLAADMQAIDVAGDDGAQYVRRANIANTLQLKVGKLLPPLLFQPGDEFVTHVQKSLGAENLLSLSVYTRFDFASQQAGAPRYLGAIIDRATVRVVDLGSAETLDALDARLLAELAERPKAGSAQPVLPAARSVYDMLLKPLAGPRARGAWVADLDGAMSLLPMEALADTGGRYLIDDTEWRYVSSARTLVRDTPVGPVGGTAPGPALVLAAPAYDLELASAPGAAPGLLRGAALKGMRFEPLPQTLEEAKAVAASLARGGTQVDLRTGAAATLQALAAVHSPRYLHIATHGFFIDDAGSWRRQVTGFDRKRYVAEQRVEGRSSGLALAGANRSLAAAGGEGILYAAQLRQLDLGGTELAVLSACDTAAGRITLGEGVDSLRQALEIAGVQSAVTSLWTVPDLETRAMMTEFYGGLAGGAGKSGALRQAKLHVKQRKSHPYYWASFIFSAMQ